MNRPHEFRQKDRIDEWRELHRQHIPDSSEGYVFEDVDLVVRQYGAKRDLDDKGIFCLCEFKTYYRNRLAGAQYTTFKLLDNLLRQGDKEGRYLGFFLVSYINEREVFVNGFKTNKGGLLKFYKFDWIPPAYEF